MTTWIYRCKACDATFPLEVQDDQATPPETTICPECSSSEAKKLFQVGGCGCGNDCCC